jgi:hypothetical protein
MRVLVDGIAALMNVDHSLPVNRGNPEEHSIQQFAELVGLQRTIERFASAIAAPSGAALSHGGHASRERALMRRPNLMSRSRT